MLAPLGVKQDQPVGEDYTRSEGVESSRSGVTPHLSQASSGSWSTVPVPRFCRRRLTDVKVRLAGQHCTT